MDISKFSSDVKHIICSNNSIVALKMRSAWELEGKKIILVSGLMFIFLQGENIFTTKMFEITQIQTNVLSYFSLSSMK